MKVSLIHIILQYAIKLLFRGIVKPDACFIIPVNDDDRDPFFPPHINCMNFVRHTGAPPLDCRNGELQRSVCETQTSQEISYKQRKFYEF